MFSGLAACQALFHHGIQSPSQMKVLGKEDCEKLLRDSGYDRYGRAGNFQLKNYTVIPTCMSDRSTPLLSANKAPDHSILLYFSR